MSDTAADSLACKLAMRKIDTCVHLPMTGKMFPTGREIFMGYTLSRSHPIWLPWCHESWQPVNILLTLWWRENGVDSLEVKHFWKEFAAGCCDNGGACPRPMETKENSPDRSLFSTYKENRQNLSWRKLLQWAKLKWWRHRQRHHRHLNAARAPDKEINSVESGKCFSLHEHHLPTSMCKRSKIFPGECLCSEKVRWRGRPLAKNGAHQSLWARLCCAACLLIYCIHFWM